MLVRSGGSRTGPQLERLGAALGERAFLAGALLGRAPSWPEPCGRRSAWPERPWPRRSSWPGRPSWPRLVQPWSRRPSRPGRGLLGRPAALAAASWPAGSLRGAVFLAGGLGHLATAGDDLLELGARTEGRNRGLLHPDLGTGGRVSTDSGSPIATLEGTETGQDDLLALDDVGVDLVQDGVQDRGGGLVVGIQSSRNGVDELGFVQLDLLNRVAFPTESVAPLVHRSEIACRSDVVADSHRLRLRRGESPPNTANSATNRAMSSSDTPLSGPAAWRRDAPVQHGTFGIGITVAGMAELTGTDDSSQPKSGNFADRCCVRNCRSAAPLPGDDHHGCNSPRRLRRIDFGQHLPDLPRVVPLAAWRTAWRLRCMATEPAGRGRGSGSAVLTEAAAIARARSGRDLVVPGAGIGDRLLPPARLASSARCSTPTTARTSGCGCELTG